MNLDEFSTVVDDRRYINPQVSLDEQNTFIENLRNAQGQRTEEIAQDTYSLGTAVPSNLGGLGGSDSYFAARYQTPQTNALVADLRATAQAQALNDVMNNALAQAKQRYSNAYKAAQRRAGSRYPVSNPSNSNNNNKSGWDGDIDDDPTDSGGNDGDSGGDNNDVTVPPNVKDYYIPLEERDKKAQEKSGMPDWLFNIVKIFG